MAIREKKQQQQIIHGNDHVIITPNLPEFDGHPYFEEKAKAAKELLSKVGLPELGGSKK